MIKTVEDSIKTKKVVLEIQPKTFQDMLFVKVSKSKMETDLIDCEAGIAFLENMIKWLENYILARKSSMGSHFAKVEKRIDEIRTLSLDDCKKGLQVRVDAWGRRPFEENIHEKGVYE